MISINNKKNTRNIYKFEFTDQIKNISPLDKAKENMLKKVITIIFLK